MSMPNFLSCCGRPDESEMLHESVQTGSLNRVKQKLKNCDHHQINSKDEYRKTPLDIAAENGLTEIASLLLDKGAKPRTKGWCGLGPLHWAVRGGYPDMVEMLIKNGADVNAQSSHYRETPLHLAVFNDPIRLKFGQEMEDPTHKEGESSLSVINMLVKSGANVNLANNTGSTPLHMASFYGLESSTALLLELGADANLEDKMGQIPIDLSNNDAISSLLEKVSSRGKRAGEKLQEQSSGGEESVDDSARGQKSSNNTPELDENGKEKPKRRRSMVSAVSLSGPRSPLSGPEADQEPPTPGVKMTLARRGELIDAEAEQAEADRMSQGEGEGATRQPRDSEFMPGVRRRGSATAMMTGNDAAEASNIHELMLRERRSSSFTLFSHGADSDMVPSDFKNDGSNDNRHSTFAITNGVRHVKVHPQEA